MSNWELELKSEMNEPYMTELMSFVDSEYSAGTCYPPRDEIMRAMDLTKLDDVKCVILGQDPYHGPDQAMGLAFSVRKGVKLPPSLKNIYKELQMEYPDYLVPTHGDLTSWANQGVLLLNSVLTVREHQPASHAKMGWEKYTDKILQILNNQNRPIVYMLWGNYAQAKGEYLNNPQQLVLKSVHPSPFSARNGFFGCNHFRQCNDFLRSKGLEEIYWQIEI